MATIPLKATAWWFRLRTRKWFRRCTRRVIGRKTAVKTVVQSRSKKPVRTAVVVTASKAPVPHRPLHPGTTTLAQLKDRSHAISR